MRKAETSDCLIDCWRWCHHLRWKNNQIDRHRLRTSYIPTTLSRRKIQLNCPLCHWPQLHYCLKDHCKHQQCLIVGCLFPFLVTIYTDEAMPCAMCLLFAWSTQLIACPLVIALTDYLPNIRMYCKLDFIQSTIMYSKLCLKSKKSSFSVK